MSFSNKDASLIARHDDAGVHLPQRRNWEGRTEAYLDLIMTLLAYGNSFITIVAALPKVCGGSSLP